VKNVNGQDKIEAAEGRITQTLKEIYGKMVETFGVNFEYFRDIKIISQPELLKQLTKRMRRSLEEKGIVYSDSQWRRTCRILSTSQVTGFLENLTFYNPEDEVLYINENVITNHPEKIMSVCTHELSEKMLSAHLPSSREAGEQALAEMLINIKKANNHDRLLDEYIETVYRSVFKEGCCEAVTLQTLLNMGYEKEAASMDEGLKTGHSKCKGLLFDLDSAREKAESIQERRSSPPVDQEELVRKILKISQIIKGLSYYMGYPLAKAVMERYGIKGVKLALEKHPPLEAEYFANPQVYLTQLEKLKTFNQ
jgi:hypothetical protein